MVDIEVIEAALKKGEGKHIQYAINTLDGMYREGITTKEKLFEKPAQYGNRGNTRKDTLPSWIEQQEAENHEKQAPNSDNSRDNEEWSKRIQERLNRLKAANQ